jgi:hypothetical protein
MYLDIRQNEPGEDCIVIIVHIAKYCIMIKSRTMKICRACDLCSVQGRYSQGFRGKT